MKPEVRWQDTEVPDVWKPPVRGEFGYDQRFDDTKRNGCSPYCVGAVGLDLKRFGGETRTYIICSLFNHSVSKLSHECPLL